MTRLRAALLTLLVAALTATSAGAQAPDGPYQVEFLGTASLSPLPDSFEAVEAGPGTLYEYSFRPVVDGRGRISGEVDVRVSGMVDGLGFAVTLTAPLSGSIRGRSGDGTEPASRLRLAFKLSDEIDLAGQLRVFKLAGKFGGILLHAETDHTLEGKRIFKLEGASPSKERATLPLDTSDSDASFSLALDFETVDGKLAGTGSLGFRGQSLAQLELRGKYSDARDAASAFLATTGDAAGGSVKIKQLDLLPGGDATFEITYKLLGHRGRVARPGPNVLLFQAASEGSELAPLDLTGLLPYLGTAGPDAASYYVVTGLDPGGQYEFRLENFSGQIGRFRVFLDSQFQNPDCTTFAPFSPCSVQLDQTGTVYFEVDTGDFSAAYQIVAELLQAGGFANEGTLGAPVEVTALPWSGMVWRGESFYEVDGLTPGTVYTATLSAFDFAEPANQFAGMNLWGEGVVHAQADCQKGMQQPGDGASTLECAARADAAGKLIVEAQGAGTTDGYSFALDLAAGGLANEGFDASPLDITGSLPWSGTVHQGGASQYRIGGLTPNATYTVTLTHSQETELSVWELDGSGNRVQRLCRTDFDPLTTVEECVVTPPTDAIVVWARMFSGSVLPGATFTLGLSP